MTWKSSAYLQRCGSCNERILVDAPVLEFAGSRRRCATCAELMGFAVDQAAVDLDRRRRDERLAREASAPTGPLRVGRASTPARLPPVRQPLPLSAIAGSFFDSKLAASGGDRDE